MLVILARHGNTFEPGDTAFWVGGRTDLPLVEKGRAQAGAIGQALRDAEILPERTIAGPLKRTRETATIALAAAGIDPGTVEIDERLREIDYGRWEAKSSAEIRTMGDGALLAAWEDRAEWPAAAGWAGSQEEYCRAFWAALDEIAAGTVGGPVLIVSSSGIFRLIALRLAPDFKPNKMATGAVSLLLYGSGRPTTVIRWNIPPHHLRSEINHIRAQA